MALALFGFDLGIEAQQLLVAPPTLPWLFLLARGPLYTLVRVAGALLASAAALSWIAQGAFHVDTPIDAYAVGEATTPRATGARR